MYHLKHFSNKDCLVSILTPFSVVTGHVMDECMGLPKEKQGEVSVFKICVNLILEVTKTEFLLTLSIQYQTDKQ